MVLGLIGAAPQLLHAQSSETCPPETGRWIAAAAKQSSAQARPLACGGRRIRLRLVPPSCRPIDVEISTDNAGAFARVGDLGVSPIVEIPDYSMLPLCQRDAFEGFLNGLAENEEQATFAAARSPRLDRLDDLGPLLLLLALVLVVLGWPIDRADAATHTRRSAFLLFAVGLVLRGLFGLWAPLHVNGQGPLWVRGAERSLLLDGYGPGYPELFGIILSPTSPDVSIFMFNAVLSAFIPTAVYLLALDLGMSKPKALGAAILLLVEPVLLRTSATEGYFTPIIALTSASALLLARALKPNDAKNWKRLALLGAAVVLSAQAARIHPVAYVPVALTPLVLLGYAIVGETGSLRRAVVGAFVATSACGALNLLLNGGIFHRFWESLGESGPAFELLRHKSLSSHLPETLISLGVVVLCCSITKRRALLLAAWLPIVAMMWTRDAYGQSLLWQSCYDRLYVVLPTLALASLLPFGASATLNSWKSRMISIGLASLPALVLSLVVLTTHRSSLTLPTTEQLEYEVLRGWLAPLSGDCRVAYLERSGKRLVDIPDYASQARGIRLGSPEDFEALLSSPGCLYFLHSSICTSIEGRPLCDAIEASTPMTELKIHRLPARPSARHLPYDRDHVAIKLLRAH